jgi:hypothetical protein
MESRQFSIFAPTPSVPPTRLLLLTSFIDACRSLRTTTVIPRTVLIYIDA